MGRFLKWVLILTMLAGGGWVALKWYQARAAAENVLGLVPPDAVYCLTTGDPVKSWKDIAESRMWIHLRKNAYFAQLTASANSLDSVLRQTGFLLDLIGSHRLLTSAHMTGPRRYDFLFLVDLGEVAGIKFMKQYLTTFSASGYSIKKERYAGEDLILLRHPSDNSTLYLSVPGKTLMVSFSRKIIQSALDFRIERNSSTALPSQLTAVQLAESGLFQLYVNYSRLPALLGCYSSGPNEYADQLAKTLLTTSLDFQLMNDRLTADGYTYLNEETESYIKTLSVSGKSATEIFEVAPQRTGFAMAFGFRSFDEFFKNFEKNMEKDVAGYKTYRSNLKQVEDYLKISLQKNFVSWIGDEIALLELQSAGKGLDAEVALILKANDMERARKELAYVEKMVRKRTPVKFKAITYRGHTISYLSVKGVFKLLLGKFFARYDKPYYTILNNFVIFSNHPQTLESILDDYLDQHTLVKQEDFRNFRKGFEDESAVFLYVNTPMLFNSVKKLTDTKTQVSLETNKEFVVCFQKIGFQLVPETGRFKTQMAEQFVEPAVVLPVEPVKPAEADPELQDDSTTLESIIAKPDDPMVLPYIFIQDLNAKAFTGYFPDGAAQFHVQVRNGFKNGSYTEYYQNGKIRMKGDFKDEQREGTWKLYSESGSVILRRTYKQDEVVREKAYN